MIPNDSHLKTFLHTGTDGGLYLVFERLYPSHAVVTVKLDQQLERDLFRLLDDARKAIGC